MRVVVVANTSGGWWCGRLSLINNNNNNKNKKRLSLINISQPHHHYFTYSNNNNNNNNNNNKNKNYRRLSPSFSNNSTTTMDAVQRRLMFEDECILVDEDDGVVGHDSKYNCHLWENILKGNALHRAFSVFLFNSEHKLLLQQRSATKVTFPLVWTNTCCSHPLYRDTELIDDDSLGVRNAAQRKLFDELGIPAQHLPVDQFNVVGRILYKAPSDGQWGEHELDYLLFIVRDVEVNLNPDEVADIKYVDRLQLKELLRKADAGEEGLKLSPWFRLVVDNFLFKWWDHVEKGTIKEAADMKIHKLT